MAKIKKGVFSAEKLILTEKHRRDDLSRRTYGNYYFIFPSRRKYNLLSECYYDWSENFSMFSNRLFDSSDIHDEFYAITVGQKIVMVYNAKYFELEENI